jgi:hypothetical protein
LRIDLSIEQNATFCVILISTFVLPFDERSLAELDKGQAELYRFTLKAELCP